MHRELPDVQAGFRQGRGTRDQIANLCWIIKKEENFRKTPISALLTMPKPLTVWITRNWKITQEMGIPDQLTCLLRNLYAAQEATVRTGHGLKVREKKYCVSGNEKYVGVLIFLSDKVDLKKSK